MPPETQDIVDSSVENVTWFPPIDLINQINAAVGNMKMLPDVAVRALELARDPDVSINEFSGVIQLDVSLASGVLAMANSVLYSPGAPTASLEKGVARIGFRQCRNLIVASSLASMMTKMPLEEQWVRDVLWQHSAVTGSIARHLNRAFKLGFDGEEFTAGLLHDFGRTLFAVTFPREFSSFDPLDFDESVEDLTREENAMGSDHCRVGAWFAAKQGLPDVLQEVVRFHHEPARATRHPRLVALVATADHMASYFQRCGEVEPYDAATNPHIAVLEETGVKDAKDRLVAIAADIIKVAVNDAEELLSS